MRRWRRRSDWTASRPVRGGLMALGGISLVLLLSTVYLFSLLYQSRRAMEDSVREDAIWAAFQADRQAVNIRSAIDQVLLSGDPAALPSITQAYDILYSRASLLDEGKFAIKFDALANLDEHASKVSDSIVALADVVDALPIDVAAVPRTELLALRARLDAVIENTATLVLASDAALDAARVAARDEVRRLETALGVNVALLVVGFAGIIGLLAVQMRQIARAGRKLAILSERNRAVATRAQAASRAKSTFLATMSHEIRTPLNGIIGASELLARTELLPDQKRFLSMVRQSGHHLLEVITDVLDFSKLESGKVEFELHRVALPEIADTLTAVLTPRLDARRVALWVDLPAIEVGTDPARLRQVLVNLTGNAVKFTAEGSVSVRGWLSCPDLLRVEIQDTGIGIAPDAMPMLFREFSQVDGSASRSYGGTGLGLAICKRIVEGMGGRIGAFSAVGKGSTFWFELPVSEPRPFEGQCLAGGSAPPVQQGAYRGRVLLVEDNPINCAVAEGLLGLLGLGVELARNGAEAISRLSQEQFDLVLMDVQMPVMTGIEATKEIRRRGQAVRIVGLTGNAFVSDRTECLRAGMDDFLAKPVTLERLAQTLDHAGLRAGPALGLKAPDGRAGTATSAKDRAPPGSGSNDGLAQSEMDAGPDVPPGDEAVAAGGHVDAELLATLARTLDANTVLGLLDDLRTEGDGLQAALEIAHAADDAAQVDRLLHSLKGAAATLGLSGTARRLQDLRGNGACATSEVQGVQTSLRAEIDRAKALVRMTSEPKAA